MNSPIQNNQERPVRTANEQSVFDHKKISLGLGIALVLVLLAFAVKISPPKYPEPAANENANIIGTTTSMAISNNSSSGSPTVASGSETSQYPNQDTNEQSALATAGEQTDPTQQFSAGTDIPQSNVQATDPFQQLMMQQLGGSQSIHSAAGLGGLISPQNPMAKLLAGALCGNSASAIGGSTAANSSLPPFMSTTGSTTIPSSAFITPNLFTNH